MRFIGEVGAAAAPTACAEGDPAAAVALLLFSAELYAAAVVVLDHEGMDAADAAGIFCAMSKSSSLSSITMAVSLVLCGELGRSSPSSNDMDKSMASSIFMTWLAAAR